MSRALGPNSSSAQLSVRSRATWPLLCALHSPSEAEVGSILSFLGPYSPDMLVSWVVKRQMLTHLCPTKDRPERNVTHSPKRTLTTRSYFFKKCIWGLEIYGSLAKSTSCPSRGPRFDLQHPHGGPQLSVTQSRGINILFRWARTCGTQKCIQASYT